MKRVKISSQGKIAIPRKLMQVIGAQEGDHLTVTEENGKLILEVYKEPKTPYPPYVLHSNSNILTMLYNGLELELLFDDYDALVDLVETLAVISSENNVFDFVFGEGIEIRNPDKLKYKPDKKLFARMCVDGNTYALILSLEKNTGVRKTFNLKLSENGGSTYGRLYTEIPDNSLELWRNYGGDTYSKTNEEVPIVSTDFRKRD